MALLIAKTKIILGTSIALISCLLVPFHGFIVILGDTLALLIAKTKINLGISISLVSSLLEPFNCRFEILVIGIMLT